MLSIFNLNDHEKWDSTVKSFKNYDVYYLSGYVKAFKLHGDGEPFLFYYEDSNCRGINVVFKRDISLDNHFHGLIEKNKYFDLATPYGYGGWIIEGTNTELLFNSYNSWCNNNNIISEFVRFHPVFDNYKQCECFYNVIALGNTVAIDIRNKEDIWTNFTAKNRNVIRKAINSGIEIKIGNSPELYDVFIEIYNKTMDKDNADMYYYFKKDFYDSIRKDLDKNSVIFYAELNGKIIASSIMIFANGRLNYHLSGSLREFQYLAPSNLLLWKASEWGNDNGLETFHLGGGLGSQEDGLLHFKKSFYRGELCRYHIGQRIFNKSMYDYLVSIRENIIDTGFFPKYRAK